MLDLCTKHYVFLIDADELIDSNDAPMIINVMEACRASIVDLMLVPFWGSLDRVRVNTQRDARWYGVPVSRVVIKDNITYSDDRHHCYIQPTFEGAHRVALYVPLYHLHYGFGEKGIKPYDCRSTDMELCWKTLKDAPNFNCLIGNFGPVLSLPYNGPWPNELQEYVTK